MRDLPALGAVPFDDQQRAAGRDLERSCPAVLVPARAAPYELTNPPMALNMSIDLRGKHNFVLTGEGPRSVLAMAGLYELYHWVWTTTGWHWPFPVDNITLPHLWTIFKALGSSGTWTGGGTSASCTRWGVTR